MLSTYQHQHVDYAGENTTFIRKNNLQCAWGQPAEKKSIKTLQRRMNKVRITLMPS